MYGRLTSCPSHNNLYFLVTVDYVSKWMKVNVTPIDHYKVVIKFLKNNIFTRFGTLRTLLSGSGT